MLRDSCGGGAVALHAQHAPRIDRMSVCEVSIGDAAVYPRRVRCTPPAFSSRVDCVDRLEIAFDVVIRARQNIMLPGPYGALRLRPLMVVVATAR